MNAAWLKATGGQTGYWKNDQVPGRVDRSRTMAPNQYPIPTRKVEVHCLWAPCPCKISIMKTSSMSRGC
jgi:hypothetical protein